MEPVPWRASRLAAGPSSSRSSRTQAASAARVVRRRRVGARVSRASQPESAVPGMLGHLGPELRDPTFIRYLTAISAGAVFMGANTYIGNAPNFMIKSIAEEAGVKMPSFFGYMFRYAIPFLIPTFVLVTLVFFR